MTIKRPSSQNDQLETTAVDSIHRSYRSPNLSCRILFIYLNSNCAEPSQSVMRIFKNRPKLIGSFCVAAAYCVMVNHNVSQKAHLIERERALSTDLGGGNCVLNSPHKTTNGIGEKRTLLAGFPGSGKRFTYAVIEGLTDNRVADDWGFSGNDNGNIIKTSYPHPEGTWSYADGMDQSLLLIRNPRWAIPSYHNMKFELDFAMTWLDSYAMLPNVYTVRPSVASWETWRDEHALDELNKWVEFVDFWMTGKCNEVHF